MVLLFHKSESLGCAKVVLFQSWVPSFSIAESILNLENYLQIIKKNSKISIGTFH